MDNDQERILNQQIKEIIIWLKDRDLEVNNKNISVWIKLYAKTYREKQ